MRTSYQNPKITRALARLDAICTAAAIHTDRLADLAHVRDDGKITVAALEAEQVCRALHAAYAELAAPGMCGDRW